MTVKTNFLGEGEEKISVAVHEPEEQYRGTVVFCHGFGSDKEGSYKKRAKFFEQKGFRAVRFDFRGNHESALDFEEATLSTRINDLKTVLEEYGDGKTLVYGTSFGGLVSLNVAKENDIIDILVLRSPVTDTESMADIKEEIRDKGVYEHMPGKKVDKKFLEDLESYEDPDPEVIDVPVLMVHGAEDSVVPVEDTENFFEGLKTRKKLVKFGGQGHRFDEETDVRTLNLALEWFEEVLEDG